MSPSKRAKAATRSGAIGDGGQLAGDRVVGHEQELSRAMALLAAHPLVRRVTPHLDGDVSVVGGAVRDAPRPPAGSSSTWWWRATPPPWRAGWAGSWAAA